jgi:hypothetical protein
VIGGVDAVSKRAKHRMEFGFLGVSLIVTFLIGRGIQAGGRMEEVPLQCYGGRLPAETRAALEGMNRDFHEAKDVWSIGSRRVLIEDRTGAAREYRYEGSTLWLNRQPLVSRIRALNFEFRDEWGNLLTHRSGNCGRVRSIVTTVRFADQSIFSSLKIRLAESPSEVFVKSRAALPWKPDRPADMEPSQVAFRQSE